MAKYIPIIAMTALALLAIMAQPLAAQTDANISTDSDNSQVLVDQQNALNSSVSIDQIGINNAVTISQSDNSNSADIEIDGSDQTHLATQNGEASNILSLTSLGTGHESIIEQDGDLGGSNEAVLVQNGTSNTASINQTAIAGALNIATLSQSGNNNIGLLSQTGSGNDLSLSQTNDGNFADLSQNGVGLALSIDQTGGASISISQTGP